MQNQGKKQESCLIILHCLHWFYWVPLYVISIMKIINFNLTNMKLWYLIFCQAVPDILEISAYPSLPFHPTKEFALSELSLNVLLLICINASVLQNSITCLVEMLKRMLFVILNHTPLKTLMGEIVWIICGSYTKKKRCLAFCNTNHATNSIPFMLCAPGTSELNFYFPSVTM